MKQENPLSKEGHTPISFASIPEDDFGGTVCNKPLKLHNRSKGYRSSWLATRAAEHLAKFHTDTMLSQDYVDIADVAHGAKVKPQLLLC